MEYIQSANYDNGICYYKYMPQKKATLEVCKKIVQERREFSEKYGDRNATIADVTLFEGAETKGMVYWSKPVSGADIVALIVVHKSDAVHTFKAKAYKSIYGVLTGVPIYNINIDDFEAKGYEYNKAVNWVLNKKIEYLEKKRIEGTFDDRDRIWAESFAPQIV